MRVRHDEIQCFRRDFAGVGWAWKLSVREVATEAPDDRCLGEQYF